MLVLTRKVGEEILIGDQIKIKVIEISGNKVRLGIDAPATLRIYREEILARIKSENRFAARWELTDYRRFVEMLPKKTEE
ncbi:MAG TPA: carbon storage regulator CsrA [Geobacteraceae bacterium]|nr:carbon storage regulator CsrA [Geobacteraceae bacterium]